MLCYVQKVLVGAIAFLLLLLLPSPVWAATPVPERVPLTLELLQERINSPIPNEGVYTIDLRQFIIDLRHENGEFRDQFYQQLQNQLNRSKKPLGLDLSDSLIQGEFTLSRLGLSTPLSQGALSPLLTPIEQEQLQRDARFLSEPLQPIPSITVFRGPLKAQRSRFTGMVNFSDTFFLHRVEASDATFTQTVDGSEARFGRLADFSHTLFSQNANFSRSTFFATAKFSNVLFRGVANFSGNTFYCDANFTRAEFEQLANCTRIQWLNDVDFSQVDWRDRLLMSKSRFTQSLLLADATLEKSTTFRESQFQQPVLLRGVS
ncbi:MAG TPA: pentapeptide repeat-containing protein, partial [Allocoleopsis sp.]